MKFPSVSRKFCVALLASAAALAVTQAAMATSLNFTCGAGVDVNGSSTASSCPTTEALNSSGYTQSGFSVTPDGSTWYWNSNQGNPPPGVSTGGGGTNTLLAETIATGGEFNFDGVDLGSNDNAGSITLTITGYSGTGGTGTKDFVATVTDTSFGSSGTTVVYTTYSDAGLDVTSGNIDALVESVTIQTSETNSAPSYIDNIEVTPTPEPSSLLLLGTGLLGLGLLVRRQLTA
jgi:hypothetical protein